MLGEPGSGEQPMPYPLASRSWLPEGREKACHLHNGVPAAGTAQALSISIKPANWSVDEYTNCGKMSSL